MRRRITMLIMAAMLALTMSFGGAGAAFAANGFKTANPGGQDNGCQGNNPNCVTTNRGGNAPPGQQ